jgi:hypothetical protein
MQAFEAGPLRNTPEDDEEENVEEEGNDQGTVSIDSMEHSIIVVALRR